MQIQPLSDNTWRVFFRTDEFRQLIKSAKHQRARTAMLLMAISLRVKTTTNLMVGQFYQDKHGYWWMHIEAKDSTKRDSATKPREVLVPPRIINQVESLLGAELDSLPDNKPVFDEGKRTIQRDIEDARQNAAVATGKENYLKVSSHDFRRYYASHYLFRLGVDKHVTRQMGGWKRIEHMLEYLLLPRDLIKNRLAEAGVLGEDPLTMTNSGPADQVQTNFDTIEHLAHQVDSPEVNDAIQNRILELGKEIDEVSVVRDTRPSEMEPSTGTTQDESQQMSFRADFGADQSGVVSPETLAKVTYVTALVAVSWTATLAPVL